MKKQPEIRCKAKSKSTGEQCKKPPIRGASVCRAHGGAAPQVQQSARARLAAEVAPSIAVLAQVRDSKKANDTDRIRASVALLDRAGYGPRVQIEVAEARDLLLERLRELRREAGLPALETGAARKEAEELILDAEVVADDDTTTPKKRSA